MAKAAIAAAVTNTLIVALYEEMKNEEEKEDHRHSGIRGAGAVAAKTAEILTPPPPFTLLIKSP